MADFGRRGEFAPQHMGGGSFLGIEMIGSGR